MLPSIELRLQNLVKALQEVILPSIPERESLARDQAGLVIAHLQMIAIQWQSVPSFEAGSLDELCKLMTRLVEAAGEDAPDALQAEAREALKQAAAIDRRNGAAVTQALLRLGGLADLFISGQGSTKPLGEAIKSAVLDYGARQSLRERVWFAGHHLDPDEKLLPPLASVLPGTGTLFNESTVAQRGSAPAGD